MRRAKCVWLWVAVLCFSLTAASCESSKKTVKDTDEWIKKNAW